MPAVVFTSLTVARKFRDDIDAELGYPRPNVVVDGDAPAPTGQTTTFAEIVKHPSRNEWAYADEPTVRGKRGRVPLPPGAQSKELEPDWEPPRGQPDAEGSEPDGKPTTRTR